jgi:hypothetical protein
MKRFVNSLVKFNCGKNVYAILVLCAATRIALPGQTFTTLMNFDGANGSIPYYGTLAQGMRSRAHGSVGAMEFLTWGLMLDGLHPGRVALREKEATES